MKGKTDHDILIYAYNGIDILKPKAHVGFQNALASGLRLV